MKARDIKNKESKIELLDGLHNITIDFNAFEELENEYGSISDAFSKFTGVIKIIDIKKFLCAGINACIENEDEHYTPFAIGKLLNVKKVDAYVTTLMELLDKALPEDEPIDEDDEEENTKN